MTRCVAPSWRRVPQGRREDEAALGVRVEHLDGFPFRAAHHVAGRMARPPGMFSTSGTTPTTATSGLSAAMAFMAAKHGGSAGHVGLHEVHPVGGLDGDAPGVEGDTLADQPRTAPVTGRAGS